MAASGARVLQLRSVEYARTHGVRDPLPIELRSRPRYRCPRRRRDHGTPADHRRHALHRRGPDHAARRPRPSRRGGVDLHRARRGQLQRRHDHPERAAHRGPRRRGVVHDRHRGPARRRAGARARAEPTWASRRIDTDREIGKVSIVGAGMRSHPGVAAKVFQTLADEDINIEMISTSPIKISCVIRAERRAPGGARAARRVRAGRGRNRARAGPAMTRVAVVGATGVVGRHDARSCCASASSPPTRSSCSPRRARRGAEIDGRTVQRARRRAPT